MNHTRQGVLTVITWVYTHVFQAYNVPTELHTESHSLGGSDSFYMGMQSCFPGIQ